MDSATIHHTPTGFLVETGTEVYLISDKDIPRLKRGQVVPLRDQGGKPLGPVNYVATRAGNVEIYLSGEVLTVPTRLLRTGDNIRRVILSPASLECAA